MRRAKPSPKVTTRVRKVLERLGYVEHIDFDYEVEIRPYGTQRLWADVMVFDGAVPVAVVEVEGREQDLGTGFEEARLKAIAWNPEDPVPLLWVAAGDQDKCYCAELPDSHVGVRYTPLNESPVHLFHPDRLTEFVSEYLERQGAAAVGELRFRQLFEEAFRSLPKKFDEHERCQIIARALQGLSVRINRMPKALQDLTHQVQQALTGAQPQFALAHAFRRFMRRYFRPLSKGKADAVRVYGRYFTPPEVVQFLVSAVEPKPGECILDFACGSGGFLGQAARHLLETHKAMSEDIATCLWGCDIDETCVLTTRTFLGLMIPSKQNALNIWRKDGLTTRQRFEWEKPAYGFEAGKFDIVLSNPPAGDLPDEFGCLEEEGYQFAGKGKGRQNLYEVAFLEQAVRMVKDGGRIGIVLPEGIFANTQLKGVREWLLRNVTVHAVVSLPRGIFPYTPSKMCAVVMTKEPPPEHHEVLLAEVLRPNMLEQFQQLQNAVKERMARNGKAQ